MVEKVQVQNKNQFKTRVSEIITEKMTEKGLSMRDLAQKADCTYEHIRNLVRGTTPPSKHLLKTLAQVLELNLKEVEKVNVSDRIRMRFGTIPLELSGKNPELEPIEREWPKLSEEHKQDIIAMVKTFALRDAAA